MHPPRVLVVAGSDSSGGAGIQADLKVLTVHGVYGMTAITALTSQNTQQVNGMEIMNPEFVRKQIDTCMEDIGADVLKTGMLASAEIIAQVAAAIDKHCLKTTVVDPVMVSTSGSTLLPPSAVEIFIKLILPRTLILSPNIEEARLLLGKTGSYDIDNKDDAISLARQIRELGPSFVLIKGGHCPYMEHTSDMNMNGKRYVFDVLYDGSKIWEFKSDFLDSTSTHGTGCSLASAIAANLALAQPVVQAVENAIKYVHSAISEALPLGKGYGPINHNISLYRLPFYKSNFIDYLTNHPKIHKLWTEYIGHSFVQQLGQGTLDRKAFTYYIIQAGYKASTLSQSSVSASIVLHIEREIALHESFFLEFGIRKSDVLDTRESIESIAYSRFILEVGFRSDWMGLQVALSPCLLGYGIIANNLLSNLSLGQGISITGWIETYTGQQYEQAMRRGKELLEEHALSQSTSRLEELVDIFATSTRLEIAFWQMGLDYAMKST